MGDQIFTCGRYKNKTFEQIAKSDEKSDKNFCDDVLRTPISNQYYPEEFKKYLLSLERPNICENNITSFVKHWNHFMEAEFCKIIGEPPITVREVHPKSEILPCGNLGVFCKYFIKKCIFNVQKKKASNYNIETFASIFPFKVCKTLSPVALPVMKLYDEKFYWNVEKFLGEHFEDNLVKPLNDKIEIFLANIHAFRQKFFDDSSVQELKKFVNDENTTKKRPFGQQVSWRRSTYVNNYLKQFPRPNLEGVERYKILRNTYNSLCAAFGRNKLGEFVEGLFRLMPEITCLEVLSLLDSDFYHNNQEKYTELFQKYLFFFTYAIECEEGNPVFFIDDALYECLKGYAKYMNAGVNSDEPIDKIHLFIWLVSLVHRRSQEMDPAHVVPNFNVDKENLRHIRDYIENFPGIESAVVDFVSPTELLIVGISIFTKDAIFSTTYSKRDRTSISDFYGSIIRGVMCNEDIKKCVIYNAFTGVEASIDLPLVKNDILEFIRKYNHFDPSQLFPVESLFTYDLEKYFEKETIQWKMKSSQMSVKSKV